MIIKEYKTSDFIDSPELLEAYIDELLTGVVIHKDPDSDYGASIPELPGCVSAGETEEEARENMREAVECHLEGIFKDEQRTAN